MICERKVKWSNRESMKQQCSKVYVMSFGDDKYSGIPCDMYSGATYPKVPDIFMFLCCIPETIANPKSDNWITKLRKENEQYN